MPLNRLNNLFGKSPFGPIQDHMLVVHQCAQTLPAFFEAVLADDWDAAALQHKEIVELENRADDLKKNIRLQLPNNFFLPVPRSDLLDLVAMQDRIANSAKDIAGLTIGRRMSIPSVLADSMKEFIEQTVATSKQAQAAIEELDELLETGFRGPEVKFVEKLIEELDDLEHKTDQSQISIRSTLFKVEKDLPPIDVMFLYQVIDLIGELADRAQKIGARLQIIIAR